MEKKLYSSEELSADDKINGYISKIRIKNDKIDTLLVLRKGSVLEFKGDAFVNAANTGCVGGGGIDGAVNAEGGTKLTDERIKLDGCITGFAKITKRYKSANTKYIIHAVGPIFSTGNKKDNYGLLKSAYKSVLEIGKINHDITDKELIGSNQSLPKQLFTKIGFCLLSAGIFRGDEKLSEVIKIGIDTIIDNIYPGLEEVHVFGFSVDEQSELNEYYKSKYSEQIPTSSKLTSLVSGLVSSPQLDAHHVYYRRLNH
jgi:O-acetyl-ADP-ribose deacetylase (regulator of RNase III)